MALFGRRRHSDDPAHAHFFSLDPGGGTAVVPARDIIGGDDELKA